MSVIVKIYGIYNKNFLIKLIQDKDGNEFSRELFNLLNKGYFHLKDLSFKNDELNMIQKNLLKVSKTKEEINYVIQINIHQCFFKNIGKT